MKVGSCTEMAENIIKEACEHNNGHLHHEHRQERRRRECRPARNATSIRARRVEYALVIHGTLDELQTEVINNTQEVVQRPRERCVLICMHRRY